MNPKYVSAEQAVQCVKSGDRVFIHGSAATPVCLVQALQDRYSELNKIELVSITNIGNLDFDNPNKGRASSSIHCLSPPIPATLSTA